MSESTSTTTDGTQNAPTSSAAPETGKVEFNDEQQRHVNTLLANQKREIQSRFSDYEDIKTKASKLDSTLSEHAAEVQKLKDDAEAKANAVPGLVADALRGHLTEVHGIAEDKAGLFLTATEPDLLLRQVNGLLGDAAERQTAGNRAPTEGTSPKAGSSEERTAVRSLFS